MIRLFSSRWMELAWVVAMVVYLATRWVPLFAICAVWLLVIIGCIIARMVQQRRSRDIYGKY